ncbi:MAG TPA: ATPase, T2SS/T4P/T4SS family [Mariprofundaceae bacterium]|nr:ATPase, T2SS/T4P/T4SS family [Mariprofundaceae bacterium]
MENPQEQKSELKVSLRLLSGVEHDGRLIKFSPQMQRLPLLVDNGVKYFDAPEIAYIGFFPPEEGKASPSKPDKLQEMIVHTLVGQQFRVQMAEKRQYENGFFAFAVSKDARFDHFFFYDHGLRSVEHPKPIGQSLIEAKVISPREVQLALEKQRSIHEKHLGDILVEQHKVDQADVDRALEKQRTEPKRIGAILIESGLINEDDLQQALAEQSRNQALKIGGVLVKMGLVTEVELISALADKFHLPFVDLDNYVINPAAFEQIDVELLEHFQVLPINTDEHTLTLASSNPLDFEAFDAIRFQTKKRIVEVLATPTQIQKAVRQMAAVGTDEESDGIWVEQIPGEEEESAYNEALELKAAEASPIVRLVNKILMTGIRKGASDIHLLPQSEHLLLLYRVNGDLRQEMELEKWVQRRVISRIKVLSGMNITDHRVTQDGRMMVRHEGGIVEFRVSCIPNAYGESIVMRVLGKEMASDLEMLGLSERDRQRLAMIVRKPHGMVLATGPTGSGKSTTLFALVQSIIDLPLHILTIEDPVESIISKANQIQVNAKVGLTFASILRNVLRHDPDVIMVGEMRDQETAEIGIQAALTGHLILSTLHTNSAVDTIIRLQDLNIPTYLLAPALRGIISQSLLKRLCEQCRQLLEDEHDAIYGMLEGMGLPQPKALYKAGKCDSCNQTGFAGRVMAYEFLEVNDVVRQAIHAGKIGSELQAVAESEGMVSKARHALGLAERGIISRDDLIRVLV